MVEPNPLPNGHPGSILLFTYPQSVFGHRIRRYLDFRSLPYTLIRVPPNMPRPLLQLRLGVNYRRIPIMSIGRDIYIDTRLMISKLETLFSEGALGAKTPFEAALEDMLEEFMVDGGPFWRMAGCIPPNADLMQDSVGVADRSEGSGGAFTKEALKENRAWSLTQVKVYFGMMEKMLGDGREWVMGGAEPGLAEIHAGWVFEWGVGMTGSGEDEGTEDLKRTLSREEFPRVWAWTERFRQAAEEARRGNEGAVEMQEGQEAEDETVLKVDLDDALGLKAGQRVEVAPADFGFTHKNEGVLVGLTKDEAVIEIDVPGEEDGKLRLHYPRINFKIEAVE
ncbi:uncharacterized protein MYCGRDRAFT_48752 [Zymoseptoria tritici IPO323]|uniref:Uncharacterized protein n=1 Tax=Zymoseptoria tritici (strain CBS 115943 / IPO323) TaxID=336722 RepID=F9XKV5_ZYMTI|nr:uncharacterized protein MYCGRDRAFT_48752 [Zymoseptoria tritici IPO323]EGP83986.1 hypothetical protein MYCGRDRAFT_48752 [Zymoseptoria tritici IPO323]